MKKYDKNADFNDPVVRCTECQELIFRATIHEVGMCPKCGNRRVRNVSTISENEMAMLKEKKVDPEFLALFEGVE